MQSSLQRHDSALSHTASSSSTLSQASTLRATSAHNSPQWSPDAVPRPQVEELSESYQPTRHTFARAHSDDQLRVNRDRFHHNVGPSIASDLHHPFTPFPIAAYTPPSLPQAPLPFVTSSAHPHYDPNTGTPFTTFVPNAEPPPPSYHTHHFPPTPPPLNLTDESPFATSFSQPLTQNNNLEAGSLPLQPPDFNSPPTGGFGARFPRWRGWLEKRALERHYARMDAVAGPSSLDSAGNPLPFPPSRKKSWGAGINDPDALSDDEEDAAPQQDIIGDFPEDNLPDHGTLPPLHVHHYGSRFLPHLPSQPLCSLLIELPPAPLSAPVRAHSTDPRSRQILLVGTSDGLYAFQRRRKRGPTDGEQDVTSTPGASSSDKWNQDIRCVPVWSGLGVYQMCVLASKEQPASSSPFNSPKPERHTSGIFLALTCPSLAKNGAIASTLVQLSAHAGSILESVASSGTASSSTSNSGHGSGAFGSMDASDSIPAANFGPAAGGGSGRAVPPASSGTVRMWNLEAIRKILLYALDHPSPHLPLDLIGEKTATKERKGKLAAIFKKTFVQHKTKARATSSPSRRVPSDGMSDNIDPLPFADESASSTAHGSYAPADDVLSFSLSTENLSASQRSSFQSASHSNTRRSVESLPPNSVQDASSLQDPALASVMGLALSSVPIRAPSQSTANASQASSSFSSLFADDVYQSFSGKQSNSKAKERDGVSAGSSKGVLFFSVHEAASDTKGSGTWYLALATARTVMVYEASLPKRGSGRSWSWVKEFYAPFPVKAMAFAPTSVSDDLMAVANLASLSNMSGSTRLRVSSADAPLSPSRKSHPPSQSPKGNARSSPSMPRLPMGKAAPTSWLRADLCVFLSFGRRAVVVRLSDSIVREFELQPLSDVAASSSMNGTSMPRHLAFQPSTAAEGAATVSDRSRPSSIAGSGVASSFSSSTSNLGHSRGASVEQKMKELVLDRRSRKHNWVGFTSIQAHIRVRQHKEAEDVISPPTRMPGRSLPVGQSLFKSSSVTPTVSSSQQDKELPKTPAPANVSFDRRVSRLDMDPESLRAYKAVQAEDSSGNEDDSPPIARSATLRKYALMDRGPLPQSRISSSRFNRFRPLREQSLDDFFGDSDLVSVKLALVSRGSVTHVLPLPLPADLARPTPLGVMQWTDTPNSVSGWARVLGVERARSTGATTLGNSGFSAPPTPIQLSPSSPQATQSKPMNSNASNRNRLGLHVSVTCVAFLASRIEVKQVSFQIPVEVDFEVSRHSELELVPPIPPTAYDTVAKDRARAEARNSRQSMFSATSMSSAPGRPSDGNVNVDIGDKEKAMPSDKAETELDTQTQELEYLCGSLLTLNPVDLTLSSSGSQSLVLPLSSGESVTDPARSTPLFSELAGDGGVIAFDWRGANDFRLFSVGVQG